tara:strand:- start:166 stop:345 length:180 start_codon:yes stop_codon:yes gene_type:complete
MQAIVADRKEIDNLKGKREHIWDMGEKTIHMDKNYFAPEKQDPFFYSTAECPWPIIESG